MGEKRVMENFSETEEELIRAFIFTNPHGDDSFVYPQPLIAGEEISPLMSAYSRTHVPMQDRVLRFLDKEKAEQTRALMLHIPSLMEIFRLPDGTLKVSRKTRNFNTEWVLTHGHDSIKEETPLFGHSENVSDITGKKITGHPLIHPQVKSTRYLSYKRALDMCLGDEDVQSLPNSDRAIEHLAESNSKYLETTEKLAEAVFSHPYTGQVQEFLRRPENVEAEVLKRVRKKQREDESFVPDEDYLNKEREKVLKGLEDPAVRKDIGKFVLDSSRVYLPAATRTSMGYSVDARTLEEIITDLISSPRIEDQKRGYSLWNEAKKIAPVILGEGSHVHVDEWRVRSEVEFREYAEIKFGSMGSQNSGNETVTVLTPRDIEMYTDRFNAVLALFPYLDASLVDIAKYLSEKDVKEVLEKIHEFRGEYDVLNPAISHGGLMFELNMGYHGYRDIFRHRRGSRSTQLLTTRLGFETPEIFPVFGLDQEYADWMEKTAEVYEEARATSGHVAEKLVPFGARVRALHSWQPNQVGYVGALRGNIEKGNASYVRMTREMIRKVSEVMPETAKYFRIDTREYPAELWKRGYGWWDAERGKNEN